MDTKTFGERISRLRKSKGLTQAELAEILSVSNKTISRWETGEGYPEITLLKPLAQALGVSVDGLLGEAESHGSGPSYNNQRNEKTEFHIPPKKEPKHGEIPVCWDGLKKGLKSFNCLQLIYFIIVYAIMYSSAHYVGTMSGIYQRDYSYVISARNGYWILTGLTVLTAAMIFYDIIRKDSKLIKVRNTVFSAGFAVGIFLNYSYIKSSLRINAPEFATKDEAGKIFDCDFFVVNRKWIALVFVITVSLYILWEIVRFIIAKCASGEKFFHSAFWSSLTIFNKIGLVCFLICLVVIALIFSPKFVSPEMYVGLFPVVLLIVGYISRIAALVGLIGFVLGIIDVYGKQTKFTIIMAVINFLMIYVIGILSMIAWAV